MIAVLGYYNGDLPIGRVGSFTVDLDFQTQEPIRASDDAVVL